MSDELHVNERTYCTENGTTIDNTTSIIVGTDCYHLRWIDNMLMIFIQSKNLNEFTRVATISNKLNLISQLCSIEPVELQPHILKILNTRKELFDSSKEVVLRRQAEEMADIISKATIRLDKDRSGIDYTSILTATDRLRRPMFLSTDKNNSTTPKGV